jgi:hypothetical protein
VRLHTRLQRLECRVPKSGRCPACRDRVDPVWRFCRQDAPNAMPVPKEAEGDTGEPCSACGWAPTVTEVVEVVVRSREDVARCQRGTADA